MNNQETVRVLIVEDDYLVSKMIEGLLEDIGYTVVGEAADGLEAVEMTQSLGPDVVLMDIKMPVMDGFEATRRIHETCPTPVVMLTAYDTPEMVEEASAAGAGAYVVKPPYGREMERAITIAMARFRDMMALRRLNAELQAEITERKRVEEALRASDTEKKAILDAMSDIVLFQDTNLSIRWGNEAAGRSVGNTQQDLVGCYCYELWHGRSEPCEGCPVLEALETGSRAMSIMTTADRRWWEIIGEPVRDRDGKIVGAIEIARDTTERKRADGTTGEG